MIHARPDYNNRVQDAAALNLSLLRPGSSAIPSEEPVFLLRGQDATSALVVEYWAHLNQQLGGDPRLIQAARTHAQKMRAWKSKKLADMTIDQVPAEAAPSGDAPQTAPATTPPPSAPANA